MASTCIPPNQSIKSFYERIVTSPEWKTLLGVLMLIPLHTNAKREMYVSDRLEAVRDAIREYQSVEIEMTSLLARYDIEVKNPLHELFDHDSAIRLADHLQTVTKTFFREECRPDPLRKKLIGSLSSSQTMTVPEYVDHLGFVTQEIGRILWKYMSRSQQVTDIKVVEADISTKVSALEARRVELSRTEILSDYLYYAQMYGSSSFPEPTKKSVLIAPEVEREWEIAEHKAYFVTLKKSPLYPILEEYKIAFEALNESPKICDACGEHYHICFDGKVRGHLPGCRNSFSHRRNAAEMVTQSYKYPLDNVFQFVQVLSTFETASGNDDAAVLVTYSDERDYVRETYR